MSNKLKNVCSINTPFIHPVGANAPTGDGYEYYSEEIEDPKTGEIKVQMHRVNVYAMIQAEKETTDMNFILSQLKKGDYSVLEQSNGQYIDSSEMPDNLADAINLDSRINDLFNNNAVLKEVFGNVENYKKDLFNKVDISRKCREFYELKVKANVKPDINVKKPEEVK